MAPRAALLAAALLASGAAAPSGDAGGAAAALRRLQNSVDTDGVEDGMPTPDAASITQIVTVAPRVEELASFQDARVDFVTRRLYAELSDPAAQNVYAMYGLASEAGSEAGAAQPLIIPPGFQVAIPFGADIGGVSPAFFKHSPDSEHDSWLTIGLEEGNNGEIAMSPGAFPEGADAWGPTQGLSLTDAAVFWMDPSQGPTDRSVLLAQVSCPAADACEATINLRGRYGADNQGNWNQVGLRFVPGGAAPAAAPSPAPEPAAAAAAAPAAEPTPAPVDVAAAPAAEPVAASAAVPAAPAAEPVAASAAVAAAPAAEPVAAAPVLVGDDSCTNHNDGDCDEPYECDMGTDMTDCSQAGFENGNNKFCQYTDDDECDESGTTDGVAYCPAGSDTHDCCRSGVPRTADKSGKPIVAADVCCGGDCVRPEPDWCQYANDGQCDETARGGSDECPPGTDTTDCDAMPAMPAPCTYAGDGVCDEAEHCPAGTDTADCCAGPGVIKVWTAEQAAASTAKDARVADEPVSTDADCSAAPAAAGVAAAEPAPAAAEPAPEPPPSNNSCTHNNDGDCDEPYECDVGTDAMDCSQAGFENGNNKFCQYTDDGECDENLYCPKGSDTHDCCRSGVPRTEDPIGKPIVAADVCCGDCNQPGHNWCQYANDGYCDEPTLGSGECPTDSDATDCVNVLELCAYTGDGMCDEKEYCDPGTDTADCCDGGAVKLDEAGFPVSADANCTVVAAGAGAGDDSCTHHNDGYCDEPYECETGTDKTDCSQAGFENGNSKFCQYANDGECDENLYCPAGSDTVDCCLDGAPRGRDLAGFEVIAADVCCTPAGNNSGTNCQAPGRDWCQYANDGQCDEPPIGGECPVGTDATDCDAAADSACLYSDDGDCDEGPEQKFCMPGTDFNDCCEAVGQVKVNADTYADGGARTDAGRPVAGDADCSEDALDRAGPRTVAAAGSNSCTYARDGECDGRKPLPGPPTLFAAINLCNHQSCLLEPFHSHLAW